MQNQKLNKFHDFIKRIILYVIKTLLRYEASQPPKVSFLMAVTVMLYKDIH